jgi:hypothetical protein
MEMREWREGNTCWLEQQLDVVEERRREEMRKGRLHKLEAPILIHSLTHYMFSGKKRE